MELKKLECDLTVCKVSAIADIDTPEEQKRVDRLNRIGIGHFRPLVTAVISRRDISANSSIGLYRIYVL